MQNIRNEILEKTKLTVSCGVGANKMLAKMAS
jgi:nucleotidyltransferase/DNA polymerase involved in DNA repair